MRATDTRPSSAETITPPRRRLTPITHLNKGYCIVVVQEENADGSLGKYLGCMLLTPEHPDDGPMLLLGEAMRRFRQGCGS